MRFVIAIALFVVAFVSIGLGVAQRTVFQGPDHITAVADTDGGAPFAVIDGATLNSNAGAQLVEISGSATAPVFMAYGRTDDVRAWLSGEKATEIGYDAATGELTAGPLATQDGATDDPTPAPSTTATPSASPSASADASASSGSDTATDAGTASGVSPVGSDLWIQEFSGEGSLVRKINVPKDVSVIIASDGSAAAPSAVSITWPLDNSTPWSGPLIVAGIGVLLLGLIALIWALVHQRRRHGPRRKTPKMPKPPKPAQLKPAPRRPALTTGDDATRGRRRAFVALPLLLAGALALSACTADGTAVPSGTPSADATAVAEVVPPVVTKQQFTRIVSRVADTVEQADATGDATLAATRLSGPALAVRTANYTARAGDGAIAAVAPFPDGEVRLILPQQKHEWPRAVFAAVEDADGNDWGLMFVQETPRADYTVDYLMRLTQSIPEVAPVELGAARYATDSKLLAFSPAQLAAQYGDILVNGTASPFAASFDLEGDLLQEKVGADYKAGRRAALPNAVVTYASAAGDEVPIAFSTNDTGAIVAVDLRETETVAPAETGAAVSPSGAVKVLSQKQTTTKGIAAQYGMQVLFYVPPVTATDQKVKVLGFAQGLLSASEVP